MTDERWWLVIDTATKQTWIYDVDPHTLGPLRQDVRVVEVSSIPEEFLSRESAKALMDEQGRLMALVARLTTERDEAHDKWAMLKAAQATAKTVTEAENEVLREALEKAQLAIHSLCQERGSTDGYRQLFNTINVALNLHD